VLIAFNKDIFNLFSIKLFLIFYNISASSILSHKSYSTSISKGNQLLTLMNYFERDYGNLETAKNGKKMKRLRRGPINVYLMNFITFMGRIVLHKAQSQKHEINSLTRL
jgi:hypothetical protein